MRHWWHRGTLVEMLQADINRSDDRGPSWPEAVSDAVYRQDMEWLAPVSPRAGPARLGSPST